MASIFTGIRDFVSRRRRPITIVAAVAGGAYMIASFAKSKFEEIQDGLGKARASRENLKRRFQQNHEDCGFTVLALLPTVSIQILEAMNVEVLSNHLSQLGKAKHQTSLPEPGESQPRSNEETGQERNVVDGTSSIDTEARVVGPSNEMSDATCTLDSSVTASWVGVSQDPRPSEGDSILKGNNADNGQEDDSSAMEQSKGDSESLPVGEIPSIPSIQDLNIRAKQDTTLTQINHPWSKYAAEDVPRKASNGFEAIDVPPPSRLNSQHHPEVEVSSSEGIDVLHPRKELNLSRMSKVEIWQEMKIMAFTRLIVSLYTISLISIQTHIQLNLLGRYAYVSSVLTMSEQDEDVTSWSDRAAAEHMRSIDLRTERRYLTFSWWLLHRGWEIVAERARSKVEKVIGKVGLKEMVGRQDLKNWFAEIRQELRFEHNGDGENLDFSFSSALFPSTTLSELETLRAGGMPPSDCVVDPPLRELLDETADFVDSPDFMRVLDATMSRSMLHVTEKICEVAGLEEGESGVDANIFVHPQSRIREVGMDERPDWGDKKVRLANLLPIVSRQAHEVLNGLPNDTAEMVEETRELMEFSTVIYTSFDACKRSS